MHIHCRCVDIAPILTQCIPLFVGKQDFVEIEEAITSVDVVFAPASTHLHWGRRRKRAAAALPRCVNVTILADDVVETDEYFSLVLSSIDPGVTLMPANATVVISDNDCELIPTAFLIL